MNRNQKLRFSLLSFFIFFFIVYGQAQKRMAVYGIEFHRSSSSIKIMAGDGRTQMDAVPSKIINFFSSDPDFIIIDRQNYKLISDEQELQKSETFMDGYVVEQGKQEGADYICRSYYNAKDHILAIRIYDVKAGKVLYTEEKKLSSSWWRGVTELDKQLTVMLHSLSKNAFDKSFPVVRVTKEKKGKAKEILVLAGFSQKLKVHYKMEIIHKVEEKVGNISMMRSEKIGEGEVIKIEDENFSTLKVTDGQSQVGKALNAGEQLECRLID